MTSTDEVVLKIQQLLSSLVERSEQLQRHRRSQVWLLLTCWRFILAGQDAEGRQAASNLQAHHPQIHTNQQMVQSGEPAVPHPGSPGAEDLLWWGNTSETFCSKCLWFYSETFEVKMLIIVKKSKEKTFLSQR